MSTAQANDFYLKALDSYPYDLPEFLESINYALSYDEDHADAHCLMGRFYWDQLCKHDQAAFHFEKALAADPRHLITCYHYSMMAIYVEEYEKAGRLIGFMANIKGVYKPALFYRRALIAERQKQLKEAKKLLKVAKTESFYTNDVSFFDAELTRVKNKLKAIKKEKSKK